MDVPMRFDVLNVPSIAKSIFFIPSLAKRGGGDLPLLQNAPYPLQNPLRVLQHVSIGKPEDSYPHLNFDQRRISAPVMLFLVDLDRGFSDLS